MKPHDTRHEPGAAIHADLNRCNPCATTPAVCHAMYVDVLPRCCNRSIGCRTEYYALEWKAERRRLPFWLTDSVVLCLPWRVALPLAQCDGRQPLDVASPYDSRKECTHRISVVGWQRLSIHLCSQEAVTVPIDSNREWHRCRVPLPQSSSCVCW